MNLHTETVQNVLKYFVQNEPTTKRNNIVKRHCGDLSRSGDYSFPVEAQKWKQFLQPSVVAPPPTPPPSIDDISRKCIFDYAKHAPPTSPATDGEKSDPIECLVRVSQDWLYPLERGLIMKNRCSLYLNRGIVFRHYLTILTNAPSEDGSGVVAAAVQYGRQARQKRQMVAVELCATDDDDVVDDDKSLSITEYRCGQLKMVLTNLLEYSRFAGADNATTTIRLKVTHKSTVVALGEHRSVDCQQNTMTDANVVPIMCGTAKLQHGSDDIIFAHDYLKKRSIDAQLMAEHKYGVRAKDEQIFKDLIRTVGVAAVTVDLLEVKHSSPVTLSMTNHCGGTSKGATFILYNSARIETLCATFDERIRSGYYPPMPSLEHIEMGMLKEEEEWELMFSYISDFPNVIDRAIGDIEKGQTAPHLICAFLSGLAGSFSVYYRHRKILTENREHLLPSLYARMVLVRCLRVVLNKGLALLNIQPLQHM